MARISNAPEGGKFRAKAAAGLDTQAGLWGAGDLLCVAFDANGEIDLATKTDCDGIIWTPEGKKDPAAANYKTVVGGNKYTVFDQVELVEIGASTSPVLAAGDMVWAGAGGDVVTTDTAATGNIFIGYVDDTGERLIVRVNGKQPL